MNQNYRRKATLAALVALAMLAVWSPARPARLRVPLEEIERQKQWDSIWHYPKPPPTKYFYRDADNSNAWLLPLLYNPPVRPEYTSDLIGPWGYKGGHGSPRKLKMIKDWRAQWPAALKPHHVKWAFYPCHVGDGYKTEDDIYYPEQRDKVVNFSMAVRVPRQEDFPMCDPSEIIVERSARGVRRYYKRYTNIMGYPKKKTHSKHGEEWGSTTDNFRSATSDDDAISHPEEVVYGHDPYSAGGDDELGSEHEPAPNEFVVLYDNTRVSAKGIMKMIDFVNLEEHPDGKTKVPIFNVQLVEARETKYRYTNLLRICVDDMSAASGDLPEIWEFLTSIVGVQTVIAGPLENDEDTVETKNSQESSDAVREEKEITEEDDTGDEFSADSEKVNDLLEGNVNSEGYVYGKDEPSRLWSGRRPMENQPVAYDETYVRMRAKDDTTYFEESEACSPHYSFGGLEAIVREVKWHYLPNAEHPWIMSVCGDDNLYAFLDRKACVRKSVKVHNAAIRSVRWNFLGTRFVSVSDDTRVFFFDETARPRAFKSDDDMIHAVSFDRTSEKVLFGGRAERLCVWNLQEGPRSQLRVIPLRFELDFILTLPHNSSLVVLGGMREKRIEVRDLRTGKLVRQLSMNVTGGLRDLKLSSKEKLIVAAADNEVFMWNYTSPQIGGTDEEFPYHQGFKLHKHFKLGGRITKVAVDDTNDRFVATYRADDTVIRGFNLTSGACIRSFVGHTRRVTSLDLGPDGFLISGSCDKSLKLWPWPAPHKIQKIFDDFHCVLPEELAETRWKILPEKAVSKEVADRVLWQDPGPEREGQVDSAVKQRLAHVPKGTVSSRGLAVDGHTTDLPTDIAIQRFLDMHEKMETEDLKTLTTDMDHHHARLENVAGDEVRQTLAQDSDSDENGFNYTKEGWLEVRKKSADFVWQRASEAAYQRQYRSAKKKAQKAEAALAARARDTSQTWDSTADPMYDTDTYGQQEEISAEMSSCEKMRSWHPKKERLRREAKSRGEIPDFDFDGREKDKEDMEDLDEEFDSDDYPEPKTPSAVSEYKPLASDPRLEEGGAAGQGGKEGVEMGDPEVPGEEYKTEMDKLRKDFEESFHPQMEHKEMDIADLDRLAGFGNEQETPLSPRRPRQHRSAKASNADLEAGGLDFGGGGDEAGDDEEDLYA